MTLTTSYEQGIWRDCVVAALRAGQNGTAAIGMADQAVVAFRLRIQ